MTTLNPASRTAAVAPMRVAGALCGVALAHARASAAEATRQQSSRSTLQPVVIAAQLLGVAEDIVSGARKDPSMVFELMQSEANRRLSALGLATSSQVAALRAEVAALRVEVSVLKGEAGIDLAGAGTADKRLAAAASSDSEAQDAAAPAPPEKGSVTKSPPSQKVAPATKSAPSAKNGPAAKKASPAKKAAPAKRTTPAAKKAATKKPTTQKPVAKKPAAQAAPAQDSADVRPLEGGETSPQGTTTAAVAPEQIDERTDKE